MNSLRPRLRLIALACFLILAEDMPVVIGRAGEHWDYATK